ncbi:MAG TPA: PaaI family thioesterase [Candidatus Dormibacteraeota bacterium]|nr:PaaI family thioesterase [Candidatus Dormibacteraeota bacterium]
MAEEFSVQLNAIPEGWVSAMGITITHATKDEVRCELTIGQQHLQGYGIVHGGVHCGIIETLSSMGAYLYARERGQHVVGLENSTSFIRAVRAGAKLRAVATPVTRGRQTQVWQARVIDEEDRVVATGRVRLLCLESNQQLAGEQVKGALSDPSRS